MSEWTTPAWGTPCFISISAKDVQRAKKFYSSVFDWNFRAPEERPKYSPDNVAFFTFTGCPSGAIMKIDEACKTGATNKGSVMLYLWADDLTKYMDKIKAAGGKQVSEIEPESDMGLMQHFEDTEGNYFGIYTVKPKGAEADN